VSKSAEPPPLVELLDKWAASRLLNCSPRHLARLASAGTIPPPRRLGRLVRWSRAELLDWIAGGCQPVGPGVRK
jgi:excisionase family DNA binding protein